MTAAAPAARATTVEVRLPSRLGFEKVAMSTAASVAKLMGFREERIEDLKTVLPKPASMLLSMAIVSMKSCLSA